MVPFACSTACNFTLQNCVDVFCLFPSMTFSPPPTKRSDALRTRPLRISEAEHSLLEQLPLIPSQRDDIMQAMREHHFWLEDAVLARTTIEDAHFYEVLARVVGLSFVVEPRGIAPLIDPRKALVSGLVPISDPLLPYRYLIAPRGHTLLHLLLKNQTLPDGIALTTPKALLKSLMERTAPRITHEAAYALSRIDPYASASFSGYSHGMGMFVLFEISLLALAFFSAYAFASILALLLGLLFLGWTALRFSASMETDLEPNIAYRLSPAELPVYTVLVALYREADVVPALVEAMRALDYPPEKLDIRFILEAEDSETIEAFNSLKLPSQMQVIHAPDGAPRTKPRALNIGLLGARGDFVVVYDAEDRPHPSQLRQALHCFVRYGPKVGCVQGRLCIDNADDNWLTQQFALEYAALFDVLLPGVTRMGFPIPLGGTSNHFRTQALRAIGGWDAWNVTEDADLGFRLARRGYRTLSIASHTYEEAPNRLGSWLRQRTRWLKGWLQTYMVHMRNPVRLYQDLGFMGFLGFQFFMAAGVLSPLLYPVALGLIIMQLMGATFLLPTHVVFDAVLKGLDVMVLYVGLLGGLWPAIVAVKRRRWLGFWWQIPLMPFYWLLVSLAAWRAVLKFVIAPFEWEKTTHGTAFTRHTPPHTDGH
jgi:glycosyltransferase XagB